MKKATTKRERKYGKKDQEEPKAKPVKSRVSKKVSLMVDYAYIINFKNKKEAEAFINKQNKEADEARRTRAFFTYV